jgi:hypothetical protein
MIDGDVRIQKMLEEKAGHPDIGRNVLVDQPGSHRSFFRGFS